MHAMRRVEGKVALVMGGGQQAGHDTGNGRAVSQVFAREGAHVAVVDRNIASAQATVTSSPRTEGPPLPSRPM